MRGPLSKVRYQTLLAVGLRPKLENLLLPQWFHRQRGGNEIGDFFRQSAFELLRIIVKDQSVAGCEELHELALDARIGGRFPVFQVIDVAFQKRVFREKFHHAEWGAAGIDDVHAAVVVAFYDVENFGGATDSRDAFGQREKHAKLGFFFETVFHHFAVTRLENMQRKIRAGKEDDVERKQRNAVRPHGPKTKWYQRAW